MRIRFVPTSLPVREQILLSIILDLEIWLQQWCVPIRSKLLFEECLVCKQ